MRIRHIALSLACVQALFAADVNVIEEIVAKVNGDIITRGELEKTRKQLELRK